MRISDWSSDVCSSDLHRRRPLGQVAVGVVEAAEGGRRFDAVRGHLQIAAKVANAHPEPRMRQEGVVGSTHQVQDRKSVEAGKGVSVRVDLGGRRLIKKKKNKQESATLRTKQSR